MDDSQDLHWRETMAQNLSAPVNLSGKWKLIQNENYDNFLQALGVGKIARVAASSQSPIMEIQQDSDDNMVVSLTTPVRVTEDRYTVGREFTSPDPANAGRTASFIATWNREAKKLSIRNMSDPENGIHIEREIVGGMLVQTQTIGKVVAKKYFVKTV